jgi:hypothetical protein
LSDKENYSAVSIAGFMDIKEYIILNSILSTDPTQLLNWEEDILLVKSFKNRVMP